jgi:hypothetical protein
MRNTIDLPGVVGNLPSCFTRDPVATTGGGASSTGGLVPIVERNEQGTGRAEEGTGAATGQA